MFERDAVKILTTVVVECAEAGLNKSASQWAFELMKDNYKPLIPEAYKRKIEKIAVNAYKNEQEPQQSNSKCPFCNNDIPDFSLDCYNCNNIIPFCIATGQ